MFKIIDYNVLWQNPDAPDIFRGYTEEDTNGIFLSIDNYRGAFKIEVLTHDEISTKLICRVPGCKATSKKELHEFLKIVGYEVNFKDLKEFKGGGLNESN